MQRLGKMSKQIATTNLYQKNKPGGLRDLAYQK